MNKKRILALLLSSLVLSASMTACNTTEETETVSTAETDEIAETVETYFGTNSQSTTDGKTETVYVLADADGNVTQTIVSDQLKNGSGKDEIKDYSTLDNIQNVKGDEEYTQDGNGNITWAADGSDIYYQGTTNKELPVGVSITYELNGQEVTADQLAGASGELKMTFHYTNNESEMRNVGDEQELLYQPFMMISGMMLDHDVATDLEVSNGKVIDDGDHYLVLGYALPGLEESLGLEDSELEDLDIDIPETVEITAQVTDFSLLTTLTVADNSFLNSLDLGTDGLTDDLSDSVDELTDGSSQLVDGSEELYDYLGDLADGTIDLKDGARTIADNMGDLSSGLDSLDSGLSELSSGLGTLQSKVADLPSSASALLSGIKTVEANLKTGSSSNPGIYEGAVGISSGASQIKSGAESIAAYAGSADSSSSTDAYHLAAAIDGGLGTLKTALGTTAQSLSGASSEITSSVTNLEYAKAAINNTDLDDATKSAIIAYINNSEQAQNTLGTELSGISMDTSGIDQMQSAAQGIETIASGITSGANSIASGATSIQSGANKISGGVNTLLSDNALGAIEDGLSQLSTSAPTLVEAIGEAKDGSDELSTGAHTAAVGAEQLADGSVELASGADTLESGASQILEGAATLKDGIAELDEEGIQKIASLFTDDLSAFTDRYDALKEYASEYNSFGGAVDGTDSSVRFIFRTDSIGE